jgi:hypothetical protein
MGFREANMTGRVAPETEIAVPAVLDVTPVFVTLPFAKSWARENVVTTTELPEMLAPDNAAREGGFGHASILQRMRCNAAALA